MILEVFRFNHFVIDIDFHVVTYEVMKLIVHLLRVYIWHNNSSVYRKHTLTFSHKYLIIARMSIRESEDCVACKYIMVFCNQYIL